MQTILPSPAGDDAAVQDELRQSYSLQYAVTPASSGSVKLGGLNATLSVYVVGGFTGAGGAGFGGGLTGAGATHCPLLTVFGDGQHSWLP